MPCHTNIFEFKSGALQELVDEVYTTNMGAFMVRNGELFRSLQIVKVWLTVDILSVPHDLLIKSKMDKGHLFARHYSTSAAAASPDISMARHLRLRLWLTS